MTRSELARFRAIQRGFGRIDRSRYPELASYDRERIYEGKMGPGGLYLAARMLRGVIARPGMRVLDLGCGRGATSVFIAERTGARVISADLWISATERQALIERHAAQAMVTPLDVDIRRGSPLPADYFDLIFCMDAFHYFGARRGVVAHLARTLKPGGRLIVGNREVRPPIPEPYRGPWDAEFSKYHSPSWWARRLRGFGLFAEVDAAEAEDGRAFWDDDLFFNLDRSGPSRELLADAEEIVLGRDHPEYPVLTHYILRATMNV